MRFWVCYSLILAISQAHASVGVASYQQMVDAVAMNEPKIVLTGSFVMEDSIQIDYECEVTASTAVQLDMQGHTLSVTGPAFTMGSMTHPIRLFGGTPNLSLSSCCSTSVSATISNCHFDEAVANNGVSIRISQPLTVEFRHCSANYNDYDGFNVHNLEMGDGQSLVILNECVAYANDPLGEGSIGGNGAAAHSGNQFLQVIGGWYRNNAKSGIAVVEGADLLVDGETLVCENGWATGGSGDVFQAGYGNLQWLSGDAGLMLLEAYAEIRGGRIDALELNGGAVDVYGFNLYGRPLQGYDACLRPMLVNCESYSAHTIDVPGDQDADQLLTVSEAFAALDPNAFGASCPALVSERMAVLQRIIADKRPYFFSPSGSDIGTPGEFLAGDAYRGDVNHPFKTLDYILKDHAVYLSSGNDLVLLAGAYAEAGPLHLSSSAGLDRLDITVRGAPNESVAIYNDADDIEQVILHDGNWHGGSVTFENINFMSVPGKVPTKGFLCSSAIGWHRLDFTDCICGFHDHTGRLLNLAGADGDGLQLKFERCTMDYSASVDTVNEIHCEEWGLIEEVDCVKSLPDRTWWMVQSGLVHEIHEQGTRFNTVNLEQYIYAYYLNGEGLIDRIVLTDCEYHGPGTFFNMQGNCRYIQVENNLVIIDADHERITGGIFAGRDLYEPGPGLETAIIRNNTVYQVGSLRGHGILVGNGITSGEVSGNISSGANWCYVVKSDNVAVFQNYGWTTGYVHGGLIVRVGHNNVIYNNGLYAEHFYVVVYDDHRQGSDYAPSDNVLINNVFLQSPRAIQPLITDYRDSPGSMDANFIDGNIYAPGDKLARLYYNQGTVIDDLPSLLAMWPLYADEAIAAGRVARCRDNDMHSSTVPAVILDDVSDVIVLTDSLLSQ